MEKPRKTPLVLLALLSALAALSVEALAPHRGGWLAQSEPEPTPTFTPPETLGDGTTLRIDGTPIMQVINRSLEDSFESRYPGSDVVLADSSTDAALQALQQGDIDLAATGRPLTDEEKAQNLSQVTIDREKIAIIVGRDNPFQGDLTYQDFVSIFRGEITNWAEVGGPDLPIRFIDRPVDSDTRRALGFYEIFQGKPFETGPNAVQVAEDDTAAVIRELRNDGISYAIAGQILDQAAVRPVSMNNTLPDDPRYPYSQPRGYVYRGEPSIPVEAFLGFATNADGAQAVATAKTTEKQNVTAGADQLPGDLAISPDGQYMVRGNQAGQLEWLDSNGAPTGLSVDAHNGVITAVAISADGQTIASSGADGLIRRWDPQGNPIGEPIQGSDGPITAISFSPDGQTLVSGNSDGTVERWNSATGEALGAPIQAHSGPVQTITYPPGGQNFITGSTDGVLSLWNPDGTAAGKVADAHKGAITASAVSPEGDTLVTGGADGTFRLWDRANLNPRGGPYQAHSAPITAIAVGAGSQPIATTDQQGNLALWDANGNPLNQQPLTLAAPANALGFDGDGNLVVSTSNGQVDLRDASGNPRAGSVPDLSEGGGQLPPELANLLSRMRNLPRSTWWILAAIPALLFLAGLLGAIFGWGRKSTAKTDPETGEEDPLDPIPGAGLGINFSGVDSSLAVAPGASVGAIEGGEIDSASLGSKLAQAKADLAEGKRLAREGQYELALLHFDGAIEAAEVERVKAEMTSSGLGGGNAIMVQALTQKGHVLATMGQPEEALVAYNAALQIDSSALEAWIGKGRLLTEMGQYEEAIFCFDTALEIDPNAGLAWAGKGRALMLLGRQSEGQSCLDRAASLGVSGPESTTFLPRPVELGTTNEPAGPMPLPYPPVEMGTTNEPSGPPEGGYDPDIPPELQQMVNNLPSEDAVIPEVYPSQPLPQPLAERYPSPAYDPDVPLELQQMVQALPSEDSFVPHSPSPDLGLPPEVLAAMGELPGAIASPPQGQAAPPIDAVIAAVDLPTTAEMGYFPQGEPPVNDPVDSLSQPQPTPASYGDSLAGLPPEVLAALASIPADSPDSFGLPATPAPVPLAEAPASAAPDPSGSWITLSIDDVQQRLYTVWQISDSDRARAQQQGGQTLALRLYDVTGQGTDVPLPAPADQQLCYNDQARDWYLAIPQWDRIYLVEVGYSTAADYWLPIARSTAVPVLTK